jgi:hypothetical protein
MMRARVESPPRDAEEHGRPVGDDSNAGIVSYIDPQIARVTPFEIMVNSAIGGGH